MPINQIHIKGAGTIAAEVIINCAWGSVYGQLKGSSGLIRAEVPINPGSKIIRFYPPAKSKVGNFPSLWKYSTGGFQAYGIIGMKGTWPGMVGWIMRNIGYGFDNLKFVGRTRRAIWVWRILTF